MSLTKESTLLLSSGHRMPIFGLGTWQIEDEEVAFQALNTAIDAGYRLVDTATSYSNEAFLGKALKKILSEDNPNKVKREELFISTKLPPNGMRPENVEYFLKKSLQELQLDYIDLYLIHFPVAMKRTENDINIFPVKDGELLFDEVDLLQTWKAMESFVDLGIVKSIGVSNCNSAQIQRICNESRIKPAVLQAECHAYLPQCELVEFCRQLNIAFTAYSPLGTPGLPEYAKKHFGVDFKPKVLLEDPELEGLKKSTGKTSAQILLRYLIERGICVIPKSGNPERIKSNIEIFDFSLKSEEKKVLESMASNLRYYKFDPHPSILEHPAYPFNIPY